MYDIAAACTSGRAQNAKAESYGTLSHLCAVAAPGVGQLDAVDQVPGGRAGRGPQPERAVHVRPAAVRVHELAGRAQVVAGAGVHVAGLQADDRRRRGSPARARAARSPTSIAPFGVGRDRLDDVGAEAEQPQRPVDRGVPLRAGDHPDPRRAEQARALDVPAGLGQHVVPGARRARRCSPPGRR